MIASKSTRFRVGNRELKLSNLDKVLYPETGFTKGQVIEYYLRISPIILPHLKGRPLTLKRYPEGVNADFFYEKRCPQYKPPWMKTLMRYSNRSEGPLNYCAVDGPAALIWVANLASLEMHTLLSRDTDPDHATSMVFDLDPGAPAQLLDCIPIAIRLRDLLKKAGLESFAKTSGGKGLHLWVPLNTRATFDRTKEFSRSIAQVLERDDPAHITSNMRKDLRPGRIFIDWSQNDEHKTTVCAYSLRARARPTVSTPVSWNELRSAQKRRNTDALSFEADEVLARVEKLGDLFAPVLALKQRLPH